MAVDCSTTFLNTVPTDETFQQSGKQDSFRHILRRSAWVGKSSSSQFFGATTEIQSGPDNSIESKLAMMFLSNKGVTWTLCGLRLVIEGKAGKGIPEPSRLEFLEKFSASNFVI